MPPLPTTEVTVSMVPVQADAVFGDLVIAGATGSAMIAKSSKSVAVAQPGVLTVTRTERAAAAEFHWRVGAATVLLGTNPVVLQLVPIAVVQASQT